MTTRPGDEGVPRWSSLHGNRVSVDLLLRWGGGVEVFFFWLVVIVVLVLGECLTDLACQNRRT